MARVTRKQQLVEVTQDDEAPVPVKVLAQSILEIAKAAKKITQAGLKEETLVLLIHDYTKLSRANVRAVLRCLPDLAEIYLEKSK